LIFDLILHENNIQLKSYKNIVFIACMFLVFYPVISHTNNPGINIPEFKSDYKTYQIEYDLIGRELKILNIATGIDINNFTKDVRICFFSASKSEIWKGLVKSHTFFTNIYIRRTSIFFAASDFIFSNKALLAISKILQDEPLLFLRI
jgi:hypothetical protein